MSNFLIIPDLKNINEHLSLAKKYGFGFEYNDFFMPNVLDDSAQIEKLAADYKKFALPEYCTCHGDFFDVLVFSEDKLIREIADRRIRQSISAARNIGARAVVFHTNYEPVLTSSSYVNNWISRNAEYFGGILEENPDMDIYMENMFDRSPEMLYMLSERLSGFENYGVCFDYAHAATFGKGFSLDEWSNTLAPYVKHMHINDNDLESDLHLAVGDGKIDWEQFAEIYKRVFSKCTVLIEVSGIEKQLKSVEYLEKIGLLGEMEDKVG